MLQLLLAYWVTYGAVQKSLNTKGSMAINFTDTVLTFIDYLKCS